MPDQHTADHDTLVRLEEKVSYLIQKVETLTDDHEQRLRFLERWVWGAIAVLSVAVIVIGWLVLIRK